MTFNNAKPSWVCYCLVVIAIYLLFISYTARADDWQTIGHLKYFFSATQYDSDNLFSQAGKDTPIDHTLNLRLSAEKKWPSNWDVVFHYEAAAYYSDSVAVLRESGLSPAYLTYGLPSDDARLFDFTAVANGEGEDNGKSVLYHRLDRAALGYTETNYVVRFGRQAVSWGNGLVFQPMDIFNPFSPTAIDKEYKTGDDMLYFQYLLESGDDIQSVLIPRRNIDSGDLESGESSLAVKYHATRGVTDVDLLMARHFADNLAGFGFATDWKGAILRGDLINVWSPDGPRWSGVASINYSWVWAGYNISGVVEYYRNGNGISNENYSPQALDAKPELLKRIIRGEIFTLGRDYLAGGLTMEITPRWLFDPLLIGNINDGSWFTQWLATFDWRQNLTLLFGADLPIGDKDMEFGGIPTETDGVYSGGGLSIFLQLAYYF